MSSTIHRTPSSKPPERRSLFFRDLASPVSAHRSSRFAVSGQTAGGSALWRENFSTSDDPPPPPVFTLEDRVDFSPEPAIHEVPTSAEAKTPTPTRNYFPTPSPIRSRVAPEGSGGVAAEKSVGSGGWWAPPAREEKGSPVDGVVTSSSALVVVPPASQRVPMRDGMVGEEEWVTVYGFSPRDTNLVLREFEKCGVILKHVPGPRDANWMHILYQNRYNAQKALAKNGAQLNSVLIIGVKPVDPSQRQYLNEKLSINSNGGFMGSLPSQSAAKRSSTLSPVPLLKDGGGHRSTGAVASPVKSVVSRVMDLMFGL